MPANSLFQNDNYEFLESEIPVARLGNNEIPEDLQLGRIFQFIRVAEIGIE